MVQAIGVLEGQWDGGAHEMEGTRVGEVGLRGHEEQHNTDM